MGTVPCLKAGENVVATFQNSGCERREVQVCDGGSMQNQLSERLVC